MRLAKPITAALLACGLAVAAAACSGSETTDPGPAPSPAPAESQPAPAPEPPPAEPTEPAPAEPTEPAPAESTPAEPSEPPPAETGAATDPVPTETGSTAPAETGASTGLEPTIPPPPLGTNEPATPTAVPADAIAIVGDAPITKQAFDDLLAQRQKALEAQGGEFPAVGTPEYETLKNQAVQYLIQREEFRQEGGGLGIEVTDTDVDTKLTELKEQLFQGDEAKYKAELEAQGVTEAQVKDDLRLQVLVDEIFAKVTEGIVVSDAQIKAYYDGNQPQFTNAESRKVAHILVETEKEANDVVARLDKGEDFAKVAKELSTDTGTKDAGGEYIAVKGQSVPEFEKAAYELKTGDTSAPVKTQFGWHVIRALEDIKPESVSPLEDVEPVIRADLENEAKNRAVESWVEAVTAKFEGKILYATGFTPPPTSTDATATDTAP